MKDNITMTITKDDKVAHYMGVICSSIQEAASLIHPDYWRDIPVGKMMILADGENKLLRIANNTMLIRHNGSRHFVQIEGEDLEYTANEVSLSIEA